MAKQKSTTPKGPCAAWTSSHDMVLFDGMLELKACGKLSDTGLPKKAGYIYLANLTCKKFNAAVTAQQVQNRIKLLHQHFVAWTKGLKVSGHGGVNKTTWLINVPQSWWDHMKEIDNLVVAFKEKPFHNWKKAQELWTGTLVTGEFAESVDDTAAEEADDVTEDVQEEEELPAPAHKKAKVMHDFDEHLLTAVDQIVTMLADELKMAKDVPIKGKKGEKGKKDEGDNVSCVMAHITAMFSVKVQVWAVIHFMNKKEAVKMYLLVGEEAHCAFLAQILKRNKFEIVCI
ncbi:hypothetical protein AMAG_11114 [Allomyces macrogynus ATCC 38327]|uniref:Uncharacterized protein n=1 Tax=Allomyces macrogynus (strain ATCC 38327) TaxID=578462 RepID=A0A0L0SSM9_ALLM3|nr:hypothetical protein AMAG_11114 [Allomyces macrogynus ATCC 38327]|eukprot:KNE65496.1 hypothetical protein AMAG_11114 [Allomyces macrogynus ATCC 38327]